MWGFHISIDRGYLSAVQRSIDLECKTAQIWVGNSKGYASKTIEKNIYDPVAELVKKNNFFLISHSPYILNFAHPLLSIPEGQKQLDRYLRDLVNITNLGGRGSVLHMGSAVNGLTLAQAQQNFVDNLWWIVERKPKKSIIILENMAGGGFQMGKTLAELSVFWNDYFDSELRKHVKWCIDTAHLFAAGEYNISDPKIAEKFYNDWEKLIGWDNVLVIHFNGSKSEFASCKDNHDDIGPINSGKIATIGLKKLVQLAKKPLVLETPNETFTLIDQIKTIKEWK
jgi:deoxyribonuclease IV